LSIVAIRGYKERAKRIEEAARAARVKAELAVAKAKGSVANLAVVRRDEVWEWSRTVWLE
jgi:hypothetical protein